MTQTHTPYIIGIAGGTASGKTTMSKTIIEKVGEQNVTYIEHDWYYKDLDYVEKHLQGNFDHPDALDTDLLVLHLEKLRLGQLVEVPQYDFKTSQRLAQTRTIKPTDVIIVDGVLVLADEVLRELFDIKIFVELDDDLRLIRRQERDVKKRGRTYESVNKQYQETVRPMHIKYVEPSKRFADFQVPGGSTRSRALEVVAAQVMFQIEASRASKMLEKLESIATQFTSVQESEKKFLTEIVKIAAEQMGADSVTLHQYDEELQEFLSPKDHSATWPHSEKLEIPRKIGYSTFVLEYGTYHVSDIDTEPNQALAQTAHLQEEQIKAFLGFRLEIVGEVLGVLLFNYRIPQEFQAFQIALGGIFATYAALAISSARLMRETTRQYDRLRGLNNIGPRLLQAEFGTTKDEIVRIAAEQMGADNVTLHQYDEERRSFLEPADEYSATWPRSERLRSPRKDGYSSLLLRHEDGILIVEDISDTSNQELARTAHLRESRTRAFIGFRLEADSQVLGVLFFNYEEARKFNLPQKNLAGVLAFYVSAAILFDRLLNKHLSVLKLKQEAENAIGSIGTDVIHFTKGVIGKIRLDSKSLLSAEKPSTSELRKKAQRIHNNAELAIRKINDAVTTRKPPSPTWTTFDEIIEDTKQILRPENTVKEYSLQIDFPSDLPRVFVDRTRISFIFFDLIVNAQEALMRGQRQDGVISISAQLSKDLKYVEAFFSNNGPPIPRERWKDIFQGMRLNAVGQPTGREGTGLWRARTLLAAQGSNIDLIESNDKQTTFVVRLPTSQPTFFEDR